MDDNLTEIIVILDKSGSMSSVRDDAIGGLNTFIEDQKAAPGRAKFTLVSFNHETTVIHNGKDIQKIDALKHEDYCPSGNTALYDAIGETLTKVGKRLSDTPEAKRPGKVIVAILTDGAENSSQKFTRKAIFDAVEEQKNKYSWQFMFLAAGQDACLEAQNIGINQNMTMTFANTGMNQASSYLSASTVARNMRSMDYAEMMNYSSSVDLQAVFEQRARDSGSPTPNPTIIITNTTGIPVTSNT